MKRTKSEIQKKKRKILNFRPLVIIALSQIIAIIFARYIPVLSVWARIIPFLIVGFGFTLYFLIFRKGNNLLIGLIAIASLLTTFFGGFSIENSVNKVKTGACKSGDYTVEGVINYVSYFDGKYNYRLNECTVDGRDTGNIALYGIEEKYDVCDVVEFEAFVYVANSVKDGKYSDYVLNGISSIGKPNGDIKKIGVKKSVKYSFRKFVNERLSSMSDTSKNIAVGMICGDTAALKDNAVIYRTAGIAHVFAVSGMHVGLLCALLSLLTKPIPIKKVYKSIIVIFTLFTYSWACGFSASSLRAAIICSVYLIVGTAYEKKDSLSALAVASITVLLMNSCDLFNAGFVLSFSLCLSLIVISPAVAALIRGKSEKLKGSIGAIFAAQAVAMPLSVCYFGSFPLVSIVSNFVIVPVVVVCFFACFIGLGLSLIIPPSIANFVADNMLRGIDYFTGLLAKTKAAVTVFPSWAMVIYFIALSIASDLVGANRKIKLMSAVTAVSLAFVTVLL